MSVQQGSSTPLVTAQNVDLTNCDREHVQFAGAIQPHGVLIAVQEPELRILQVSANTQALFGIAPDTLRGRTLDALFTAAQLQTLRARCAREPLAGAPQQVLQVQLRDRTQDFYVFAHRINGVLLLECEAMDNTAPAPISDLYSELRSSLARLQATRSLPEFFALAVQQIRTLTISDIEGGEKTSLTAKKESR